MRCDVCNNAGWLLPDCIHADDVCVCAGSGSCARLSLDNFVVRHEARFNFDCCGRAQKYKHTDTFAVTCSPIHITNSLLGPKHCDVWQSTCGIAK